MSTTQGNSDPPKRRGCSTRIKPASLSSRIDSSGHCRSSSARRVRSTKRGTMARARDNASSTVRAGATTLAMTSSVNSHSCGSGSGLLLRCLRCGKVELDRDAVGILDEHLVQVQSRNCTLEEADIAAATALDHFFAPGHRQRDVIKRSRAAAQGIGVGIAQRIDEPLRVGKVHAHDVDYAVVSGSMIQVDRRFVAVQPESGEIERRTRADLEPDDLGVELSRRLNIERADRVMVDALDIHRVLLNA